MDSNPWLIVPVGLTGIVLLFCTVVGIVNLATYYTIRLPKREPFPTIRRRAVSIRDIIVPGFLALLTGLLISLAAAYLFDGFTRNTTGTFETGVWIFLAVVVAFAITGVVWFRGGMEIGDLAKDPATIAAAAKTLHGSSTEVSTTLRILHQNHQDWQKREGALAFSPGTRRASAAADTALERVMPRGRPPQRTRWALLWPMLRLRPALTAGPLIAVVGSIIALSAVGRDADSTDALEIAALRATVITICALALLSVALLWWSEIVCSARRYRIGRVCSTAAESALAAAGIRHSSALARERSLDEVPTRIDRWGIVIISAVALSTLPIGFTLLCRRR